MTVHLPRPHPILKPFPAFSPHQDQVWAPEQNTWAPPSVAPTWSINLASSAPPQPLQPPKTQMVVTLLPWTHALPTRWSAYELTYEDAGQVAPLPGQSPLTPPIRVESPPLSSLMPCALSSCPFCVFMCTCPPSLRPHGTVAVCHSEYPDLTPSSV